MIAIFKIDSADIINETQSDTLALCLIPSNRIRYKLSELPIIKEIINQNVDVHEEPEPIDPDNYIFVNDVPEYFWKFIKYALSKPANINPDSYLHLCNLLLATPNKPSNLNLYDFTESPNILTPFPLGAYTPITFGNNSYIFQNYSRFASTLKIYPRQQNITIQTVFYTDFNTSKPERIWQFLNPTNFNNNYLLMTDRNIKSIRFYTRSHTLSGYSYSTTVTLTNSNTSTIISNEKYPTTLTTIIYHSGKDTTTSANISLRTDFAIDHGTWFNERDWQTQNINNLDEKIFLSSAVENIGSYISSPNTLNAIPNLISQKVWIEDIDNLGVKNLVRYIDFNKSKVINEKLMMIV